MKESVHFLLNPLDIATFPLICGQFEMFVLEICYDLHKVIWLFDQNCFPLAIFVLNFERTTRFDTNKEKKETLSKWD